MSQKSLGNLGILIMAMAFLSKAVYFFVLNPEFLENYYYRSSTFLYMPGTPGDFWMRYIYYSAVGLLGVLFSYQLYRQVANTKLLKVASSLLLVSSLLWISFGYVAAFNESDVVTDFHTIRIVLWILLGLIAFLIIAGELENILGAKYLKWPILVLAILMVGNTVALFSYLEEYGDYGAFMNWFISFLYYGVLGIAINRSAATADRRTSTSES